MIRDAKQTLREFAERADQRLRHYLDAWRAEAPASERSPSPADVFQSVQGLTLRGGKRLRPALAWYATRCIAHGLDETAILDACLSLELLQTALLIHDDIMDCDDERRGGPTVHVAMARTSGDAHLGDSIAMLAGSLALAFAQRVLCESGLPERAVAAGAADLALIQAEVIYGQHLDLIGGVPAATVQDLKTTSYTTRGPVVFGARLVGATPAQVAALQAYATPLGRAFQTRDDLLGAFGDTTRLGKPVGADLRAGRETELVQIALARSDSEQRTAIERVLGQSDATEPDIARACAVIAECGARAELEQLVSEKTAEAVAALDPDLLGEPGRRELAGVALWLADRLS